MTYFYSATQNTFFPTSLRSDYEASGTWPSDGVEVNDEVFNEMVSCRSADKMVKPDSKGYPVLVDVPAYIPTIEEQNAAIDIQRLAAYQKEADPLFFRYQRGEVTEDVWLAKVEEIKQQYPKIK